jgi:hypothetical protein
MEETACQRCGARVDARDGLHLARLCEPCLKTLLVSGSDGLAAFLSFVDRPAALVGRDHTVLHSNGLLGRMLEKFDHDIVGRRIGEALECRYAAEGLGCGKNEVCLHCGLRRVIELARITGEKIARFPTTIRHRSGDNKAFTFATEKAGEAVLMMIGTKG